MSTVFAPNIRTAAPAVEVGWFSALCGEDLKYLGVPAPELASTFEHCSAIFKKAERLGYQSILMPSGYTAGQEPLVFAGAMAVAAPQIQQLVALRMGEIHPPMLARHIATLDHILKGRLTVNIISSDLAGERMDSGKRYVRSDEVLQILRQCWTQDEVNFDGEFYKIKLSSTKPVAPYQKGGPMLYFGGISEPAREICAKHCDVYLMWPETEGKLAETMEDMSARAARHGRVLDFGLRIHVIVRETEAEARAYAQKLISKLDDATTNRIRSNDHNFQYEGTKRQDQLRAAADDDYIEDHIWSGIGRVRAGCGSAIVGDPDQVLAKINRYIEMGMRSFIFSGYPHLEECDLFARYVLPRLQTTRLPVSQGRVGAETSVARHLLPSLAGA
jgi:alkanesulfonate monooxygenase